MVTPLLPIEISYLEQRIPQFDQLNGLVVRKVESRKQKVESRKLKVDLIQFYFQNSCFLNKVALLLLIFQLFSMVTFPLLVSRAPVGAKKILKDKQHFQTKLYLFLGSQCWLLSSVLQRRRRWLGCCVSPPGP